MAARILAVVVSYKPEFGRLSALIKATGSQVEQIVIVDNASANISEIKQQLPLSDKLMIKQLSENLGIAAAHNCGIEFAIDKHFDYVLFLDQDSVPQSDMVRNLLAAHQQCSQHAKVSAVGASYLNQDNQSASFFVRFGKLKFQRFSCQQTKQVIAADFLISSGSLISVDSIKEIGKMDQSLFIDHVDTEWFLRARSMGFQAFGVCNAKMQHGLGEKTHRIKLKRERNVPQHKPFRYYYIFRNSVLLYKRGYCSALWKWNDLQRLASIALMYGLFVPPRRENLSMMFKGIKDGLSGRTGPL